MSARWHSPLLISALCAAFIGGPFANLARAQCNHGGGRHPRSSSGLPPQQMMQQQLLLQQMMQQQLLLQQIQQRQLMQTVQLERQMRDLARQGPEALKTALRDPQAEKRLLAALTIGKYGPALTDDLIERLTDDQPSVRQAARSGLVRLSTRATTRDGKPITRRSVDFGPALQANRAAQKGAARKWHTWFERQETRLANAKAPAALAKGIAAAPAAPAKEIAAAPAAADPLPQRIKPPS